MKPVKFKTFGLFLSCLSIALLSFLFACSNSTTIPTTTIPVTVTPTTSLTATTSIPGNTVNISLIAQGYAFDKSEITAPAGANVIINFENKDNGIPHNFAAYTDSSATTPIYVGEIIRILGDLPIYRAYRTRKIFFPLRCSSR
jgi:plastocyanin